jgi:hypothetical protein
VHTAACTRHVCLFFFLVFSPSFILFFVFVSFCCPSGNELALPVDSNQRENSRGGQMRSGLVISFGIRQITRETRNRRDGRRLIERDSSGARTDDDGGGDNNNNGGRADDKPAAHDLFTVTEEDICASIYEPLSRKHAPTPLRRHNVHNALTNGVIADRIIRSSLSLRTHSATRRNPIRRLGRSSPPFSSRLHLSTGEK